MSSLLDFDKLDLASSPNQLHPPPSSTTTDLTNNETLPIKSKQSVKIINNFKTEILIQSYANKLLIIVTQLGRIGSMIQINPPPLTAPSPISLPQSTHPSLFPSLPLPHPAATLTPIFGVAPSFKLNILYDLYANQIGAIIFNDVRNSMGEDGFGGEVPILLGIGLKEVKGEEEDGSVTDDERKCFGQVMEMIKECRVW